MDNKDTCILKDCLEYTLEELSIKLSTSVYTLRRRIKEGKLKAVKRFGRYYVKEEDAMHFLNKEQIITKLVYFNMDGKQYDKKVLEKDKDLYVDEVIYLVEEIKVLGVCDATRIYYGKDLNLREGV